MVHGLNCSTACGVFPAQGSNPCLLHWQADSQPLCHQGSPMVSCRNSYISWLLPYLFRAVPQSHLRGCVPDLSPQQVCQIKSNSQKKKNQGKYKCVLTIKLYDAIIWHGKINDMVIKIWWLWSFGGFGFFWWWWLCFLKSLAARDTY